MKMEIMLLKCVFIFLLPLQFPGSTTFQSFYHCLPPTVVLKK